MPLTIFVFGGDHRRVLHVRPLTRTSSLLLALTLWACRGFVAEPAESAACDGSLSTERDIL